MKEWSLVGCILTGKEGKDMNEKYVILSLLYLEWFTQKLLCLPYKIYIKFSYWNFNRTLDQRNKELAEQTPFPHHD